ncbi:bifunctional 4-hydroxy-3-methylbut-2-enyl diphosphate reductase/30S ribosomal protein S1 [Clostridium sp. MD294]|uniref:bifunctional 4-hydroxy-3-methylbut-2-enyl diphosphate reductase/30S ribosomal protein S1 n=1 Tax=Clostridium sp. MD294 TaxID=97138 RepID=UPI0002CBD936|nr:bifunctional 4-hydroxy-3-methylbut-2-enyl diphosphate reductase/30S ribosomal protein S1 [Clostridium sp. MD294]NDO46171.1 bifunctional 4-hydroxy-3-methylbut-2-enyl diphosphate reductase/30S ribosomal protein S1 [Clostridium sp. MD294]USF30163.1 4-hydroxy-3-methylbut-2-enyl diphosphate reductase [Clostridium sp. MD294]
MAEIIVAKSAGFCFGVSRAINMACDEINKNKNIYTYGPLIHNKEVIADLEKKGIHVIENLEQVKQGTVMIRSHGVGQKVYDAIKQKGLQMIDGTCPFVKRIHDIVKQAYEQKKQIIIIGDGKHPEVQGINGWCEYSAIILAEVEQTEQTQFCNNKNYTVVVQTTFRKNKFDAIIEILKQKGLQLDIFDTICSATAERQQEAVALSKNVNKMIVIGDKSSSNTQKLFEICKKHCKKTYYIETICNLVLNIFDKNDKIGITAGASTPPAIIKEVIGTMSEALKDAVQNNGGSEEELTFEQMLEQSFVTLHTGDVVKGTVINISNEEVSVNLNYKSDGIIPKGEYSRDASIVPSKVLQPGDEIEVFVVRVNDGDGNVLLSRKRIEDQKGMEEVEAAYQNKTIVTGKIVDVVRGGLIAMVNGVRIFIPSSQVSNKFIEDLNVFKGKELEFNIIELDKVKRRFIGGRKALIEKEILEKKASIFEKLEIGSKVKGKVSRITDFGAFVDLGGVDGLIHISEMSWGRITNPKEVLKEGQEIEVIILDVDKEKGKISLSLKDSQSNPWTTAAEKYPVGSVTEGKVVRMVPFGAFVELEAGVDGLVHISQIANKHVEKPEDELKVGEMIKVKILEVNTEQKKISLSKRKAEENTEETPKEEEKAE